MLTFETLIILLQMPVNILIKKHEMGRFVNLFYFINSHAKRLTMQKGVVVVSTGSAVVEDDGTELLDVGWGPVVVVTTAQSSWGGDTAHRPFTWMPLEIRTPLKTKKAIVAIYSLENQRSLISPEIFWQHVAAQKQNGVVTNDVFSYVKTTKLNSFFHYAQFLKSAI